jgi:predicted amino acid racemase
MPDPRVTIDLAKIEHNARTIVERCRQSKIEVFGVTKGTCGLPHVARAMLRGGVAGLADSRFENIRRLRDSGLDCPIMLLRSPPLARIEELVRMVDLSLQSELQIIQEISRVAERSGRIHEIILMVDLGDLREGIWPSDLLPVVEQVQTLPGVRIAGLGTNLTCFGAILPTEENLNRLVAQAYKVERATGRQLDWLSGGNSSSLPLLLSGRMPPAINNLRIGEAILQGGRDTFLERPWPALERDACTLSGELLEVKVKPSLPIGEAGVDAFGQKPRFVDQGDRLRGIANIGREDVVVDGLLPLQRGVQVLGASSDHLVLDLTDADPPLAVGDTVSFGLNYGALLAAMTSEYVEKLPINAPSELTRPTAVAIHVTGSAGRILADGRLAAGFAAMGLAISPPTAPLAPAIALDLGETRQVAWTALQRAVRRHDAIGLIWLDSSPAMLPDDGLAEQPAPASVLHHVLSRLPPTISPENIVLVGLRDVAPAEAVALKAARVICHTMVEIDALGLRHVMREALKVASAGTAGFHVAYSTTVTDLPGWAGGVGGITVRETHQAMEALAQHRGLLSMSVSGLSADLPDLVVATCQHVILSAFGKSIL